MSPKGTNEERVMYSKTDTIDFMIYDKADKVMEEPFKSLPNIHQIGLEASVRGSYFIFVCIYLLYSICHKVNPNRDALYTDSPDLIKNKKATINPVKKIITNSFNMLHYLHKILKELEKIQVEWQKLNPL